LLVSMVCSVGAAETKLLPWQQWIEVPIAGQTRRLDGLVNQPWYSSGGKEGTLAVSTENGPWGGRYFNFHVKIDHFNKAKYPRGWPAFQYVPKTPLDYGGYDCIQFWIRAKTKLDRRLPIRFILHTNGKLVINDLIPGCKRGEWNQARFRINGLPNMDKVTLLHFFICENEYEHGEEVTFQIGGFELCRLEKVLSKIPAGEAAAGLWVGERADTSDEVVICDADSMVLPVLVVIETGEGLALRPRDRLKFRFYEVFTKRTSFSEQDLQEEVPPATIKRLARRLDLRSIGLSPGYYLVTADVVRDGESLLAGRVGCDDVYIKKPGEAMTFTVLSIRTGMVLWVRDLLYGDIMCRTNIALPHVYDPLDKRTYADFVRLFARRTGKHTEGNEAGDTGLVLAAEAFRKSGDEVRARFVEWLLKDSFEHMMSRMQAPNGATITWTNELADHGIGKGGPTGRFGFYDTNQVGEWLRPLAYGMVYFSTVGNDKELAARLNRACRKAANYLVAHSTMTCNGIPNVIRHFHLTERPDGTVERKLYHQEGIQCDVYVGRALSGLSYYAYAMQITGDTVPENYWEAMDNTVKWALWKMKPDTGWFDYQCADVVEGGCHTYLGNIYIGEGLFGCYLADRMAGRTEQAAEAARAAKLAYRYVTDHCYVHGGKFEYPLEFWVGPYVYWLFTQYMGAIGPDERFRDWLTTMDRRWSIERGWRDFLVRGKGGVGRTQTNGMLEVSILGYLAVKWMDEIGKPYRLYGIAAERGGR